MMERMCRLLDLTIHHGQPEGATICTPQGWDARGSCEEQEGYWKGKLEGGPHKDKWKSHSKGLPEPQHC